MAPQENEFDAATPPHSETETKGLETRDDSYRYSTTLAPSVAFVAKARALILNRDL